MTRRDSSQDLQNTKLHVFGPSDFNKTIRQTRYFMGPFSDFEFYQFGIKCDQNSSLANSRNQKLYTISDFYQNEELKVDVIQNYDDRNSREVLSFFGHPTQKRGKFLPEEAIKLGCNPREHFKYLCKGQSVTLKNGTVVKPEEVMLSQEASNGFLINYIPNQSFVDSVINNHKYEPYYKYNRRDDLDVKLIYHSLGSQDILMNENYIKFMEKFGTETQHVID